MQIVFILVCFSFAFNAKAQYDYDFADTCSTGQLLYYKWATTTTFGVSVVNGGHCDISRLTGHLEIPSSVVHNGTTYNVVFIEQFAFENATGLTSVTIPNTVLSIYQYAFTGCTGLTSITIPNSVTNIASTAFDACTGLTSIVVESGNPEYDSRDNCNAIIRKSDNTLIFGCQ